ncbi:uncharacterized protein [Apostichopus japonicus]|uniref:uncharacterized protein n=1 Tax=Stichopus japonicus TaxID=307972 RepID=UPI003AB77FF5
MGNKTSQPSSPSTPSDDVVSSNVQYQSRSSVVSSRGQCSQSGCYNYKDQGNCLGFCEQCYRRYKRILFDKSESHGAATSSRSSQRGLHLESSSKLPSPESHRLSRDSYSTGLYRTATTTDPLSSHISSQRPAYDGISARSRTTDTSYSRPTCTSYTRTTFTISAQPTGTRSSRPTGTPSTRTTVNPSARPTVNPPARPTVTPPTRPTGTHLTRHTGTPSTRTTAIPSTRPAGTHSTRPTGTPSTRTTVIPSARPIGTHSTKPTCTPSTRTAASSAHTKAAASSSSLYNGDTSYNLFSNEYKPTPSASSAGTASGGYGCSSCGSVTSSDSQHNVMCQLNASMSNQDNAGARPKQYKATNQAKPKPLMDVVVKPKESTAINTSSDTISALPGSKPSETSTKQSSKKDSQGVLVKTMRDNLLCPICLDLLENAKTLPCQHVVCKTCLEQWVAMKGELRCPTCNTRQQEPFGGVNGLPSNFMLNTLAAEIRKLDTQDETETGIFEEEEEEEEEDKEDEKESESGTPLAAALSPTNSCVDLSSGYTSWQSIPVAETSFLEILGKQFKLKGSTVKLKLQFCDVEGQPIRGKSRDGITAFVVHPDKERIPILDVAFRKRSGDFTVSFAAEQIGIHLVEVTLNGVSVVGSPSKIVVRPNGIMDRTLSPTLHAPKGILATPDEIYVTDESDKVYVQTDWQGDWDGFGMHKPPHKECTQISPFGIAKYNDKLFITDSCTSCVYVYVHMACTNNFGKRVMEQPTGIAVSKDGTIYVADCASNTIDVFRHNYSHIRSIDVKGNGSLTHLAVNQSEDRCIVADDKTNVIKIIDLNRDRMVKSIKTRINQAPATPFGVALDDEDNIYVSVTFDPSKLNKRNETARNVRRKGAVVTYNSDGYFLGTIGEKELINPRGICFINDDDDSPQLLVVEGGDCASQSGCIKVFRL